MEQVTDAVNTGDQTTNVVEEQTPETKAESVNERLLRESKEYKAKMQQALRELETLKKAKAEEQGDFKKLYEQAASELTETKKAIKRNTIKSKVQEVALRSGCVDVDGLLKLGNPELLQYDEDNAEVFGVELFIDEAKRSKPYLFSQQKPASVNPVTPGGVTKVKTLTKDELVGLNQKDLLVSITEGLTEKYSRSN